MEHAAISIANRLKRFSTDPDYRHDVLWQIFARPRDLLQPYGDTAEDRYPELFRQVAELIPDHADCRLLSFGCATGEEAFTLRRYFPLARITGVDINPRRIRQARQARASAGDDRTDFAIAGNADAFASSTFDAVFCLAVFRHGKLQFGPAPRSDKFIRFTDFERTVTRLTDILKPGGLLVLRHANFRLRDTAVAAQFEVVGFSGAVGPEAATPIYGRDDRLVPGAWEDQAIFRRAS